MRKSYYFSSPNKKKITYIQYCTLHIRVISPSQADEVRELLLAWPLVASENGYSYDMGFH